jgi:hypothetical protein
LNKYEQFACRSKEVKKIFLNEDNLFISFGFLNRNFYFDNKFIKRPYVEGIIMSSFQINKRLNVIDSRPILSFYVIRDDRYTDKYIEIFTESILPKMYEWYHKILSKSETSIPGVEELLIEWTGEGFKIHSCIFS